MKSGKETPIWENKPQNVRKVPVDHYALYAFCEKCGGEQVWITDISEADAAEFEGHAGNPHRCEDCGHVEYFDRFYPDVITEVKFKGKKEIYNSGKVKKCDCED